MIINFKTNSNGQDGLGDKNKDDKTKSDLNNPAFESEGEEEIDDIENYNDDDEDDDDGIDEEDELDLDDDLEVDEVEELSDDQELGIAEEEDPETFIQRPNKA